MRLALNQLWNWRGEITRGSFAVWAGLLLAVKYNLDRLILAGIFQRHWSLFSYLQQPFPGIQQLSPTQTPREFLALVAASLPFLWMGVMLCLQRLRSARLPLWLAGLFVVPIVKWFLFIALAVVPGGEGQSSSFAPGRAWFPKSVFGSALVAVAASVLLAIGAVFLSVTVLRGYGWGLFVGVPFCMGFLSSLIHGLRQPRRLAESLSVSLVAVALTGVLLLVVAFEGVICLVMAAPLALALSIIGALAGHLIQASRRTGPQLYCIPVISLPLMFASERLSPEPAPLLKVVTAVEVNASPDAVWKHVVEFTQLTPPKETLFKLGIAYPIRAEMHGHGPGAVRRCIFSTGPFIEPIESWDEPRLLSFSVASNPAPLEEWTPYRNLHPAHLNGFLVSDHGQFRLIPLSGDRTCLEGTTWYRHSMWPVSYWQAWSDHIIHAIHQRVLRHVKEQTEANVNSR